MVPGDKGRETVKGRLRMALAVVSLGACLALLGGCAGTGGKTAATGAKAAATTSAGSKQGMADLAAGDAALANGDAQEAGRLYLAGLKDGAAPAVVHTRMGDLYLGLGEYPKAVLAYQESLKNDANYAPAMQGLGFALYLGGSKAEAQEALAKALERDPSLPRAAALLGTIEARDGRPEAALAVYDRTLAVAFDPDVENNRGIALLLVGRTEDAVNAFRKASASKKSPKIANNLGLALCRLGRYDDAYAVFAGVGTESAALNNLGVCYMEAGNKAKAQELFERAIVANPRFYPVAQENLSRLSTVEEVALPSPAAQPASPAQPPAPAPQAKPLSPPASAASPAPVPAAKQPVKVQASPALS
jgi:Tfp pilus assembly protein PilF